MVNVGGLEERFEAGQVVNEAALREVGLVNDPFDGVKVCANGDISKALTLEGVAVSATAQEKIEKAGGSIVEAASKD